MEVRKLCENLKNPPNFPETRNPARMTGEGTKPRGKLTSYAFFVQICREEHKRKFPEEKVAFFRGKPFQVVQVDFTEFSRKCADRWKIMSDIEKKR